MSGRTYLPPADVSISVPGENGDASRLRPAAPEGPLLANVQYGVVSRVWGLVLALATTPLLLHGLGAERFGVWVLLSAIAGYLTYFDFGIGVALAQLLAMEAPRSPEETRRMVGTGTVLSVLLAVLLAAAALLARPLLFRVFPLGSSGNTGGRDRVHPDRRRVLRAGGVRLLSGRSHREGKAPRLLPDVHGDRDTAARRNRGRPSICAEDSGSSLSNSLVWSVMGEPSCGSGSPGAPFRARECPAGWTLDGARQLLGFGWKVQITNVAAFALQYVDRLIVGSVLGVVAVSRYEVGARVDPATRLLSSPVGLAVLPRAAHQFGRGDTEGLRRLARPERDF